MMSKNAKKVVSRILSVSLLLCMAISILSISAFAVTPRWVSINSIDLNIAFNGERGNALGSASKQSTANKIEGPLTLYELVDGEWEYIDEWYNSRTRGTLAVSGDFTCESGVTYKAVFVVTAYTGTASETETVEYIDTCP